MENWRLLEDIESGKIWEIIYERFMFKPNSNKKRLIEFPKPVKRYDISNYYDEKFDEKLYDNLHIVSKNVFSDLTNGERMFALSWQHNSYSFDPNLPFEEDEFGEWMIPIFPNGDFNFFVTSNLANGVFADGINLSISIFGDKIIRAFSLNNPEIFK